MLPDGWLIRKLSELATVSDGIHTTPVYCTESEYCFINGNNLSNGKIVVNERTKCVPEEEFKKHKKNLNNQTILMSINGTIGNIAYYRNEQVILGKSAAYIILKKEQIKEYFYYLLQSEPVVKYFESELTGSTIKNLSLATIKNTQIKLPPLSEQQKIADILSTWDQAIDTVEALIANSQAQKKALMQQLLTGKRRLPEFSGEWETLVFGEIFDRVTTKNNAVSDNVLTISAQHGLVSQTDFFNKSVAANDLSHYTLLKSGDFAYNKSYSTGYPMGAIKPLTLYMQGVVSSLYICFRLKPQYVEALDYFRHFFEAGCFNKAIYSIAQEGARNHGLLNVSVTDFFNLKVVVPQPGEMQAIANFINTFEESLDAHRKHLDKLQQEKAALMQQLLTGKRRVTVSAEPSTPKEVIHA